MSNLLYIKVDDEVIHDSDLAKDRSDEAERIKKLLDEAGILCWKVNGVVLYASDKYLAMIEDHEKVVN